MTERSEPIHGFGTSRERCSLRECSWEPTEHQVPLRSPTQAAQTDQTASPASLSLCHQRSELDQSPVSRQKVICCNSWESMSPTAISDPVLLHGSRRRGRTSVWLRAYLKNCATLAIKAPAPGCSTFPECKDTIPVNWLHSPHRH